MSSLEEQREQELLERLDAISDPDFEFATPFDKNAWKVFRIALVACLILALLPLIWQQ